MCFTASPELAKTRCGKGIQCLRSHALVPRGIALPLQVLYSSLLVAVG